MGFLRHIRACNPPVEEPFVPWQVAGQLVGWLRPALVAQLRRWPGVFQARGQELHLNADFADFSARSAILSEIVGELAGDGVITPLLNEPYPVTPGGRQAALCVIDRAAAAPFGVRSFGQHLNGYVREAEQIKMWIGRRARDRLIFPGKLDNMVAGGLPYGVPLAENLAKECQEEAALPSHLARQARPVGAITYNRVAERGFRSDVLYCYDLELPVDFVPQNMDGEVEEFLLLTIQKVAELVQETDEFKLNCNLVIIDFLVRHGYLTPQHQDYLDIVTGLRPPLGGPTAGDWTSPLGTPE